MPLKKSQSDVSGVTKIIKESLLYNFESFSQLIKSNSSWDNLNVSSRLKESLKSIAFLADEQKQLKGKKNEQKWFICLFTGLDGTGKTMAAQVIANELNLDLYRIDLNKVVSKYIGETEKNLKKIFDAVEVGDSILLFDEADALFGKRTDVKDSHDRYANIEVSYLLQIIEEYQGIAILSTNRKANIDTGFTRRLRYVFHFPKPKIK